MSDALIVANKLTKTFGFRVVLRGLDFSITRGSTVALLGTNGSGKTTLLRILAALSKPSSGVLTIGGWNLPQEAANIRAQLGVVMHLPLLYDDLSAQENLQFFARLYDLTNADQRIAATLDRVGLGKRGRDLVRTFSRGMQQRLAIARALIHDPAVLLLDEPYTGLDVNGAQLLDELFAEWKQQGKTVIASLHELHRAASLSDHTIILNAGQLAYNAATPDFEALSSYFQPA
ncbi:MAG: heme ABC exporter ATP-binding protein CcmA [Anaerolineae bacterium]|nr:heme ABC exporter ATP-binding protein CcmA [Anaerolineae bacterium]